MKFLGEFLASVCVALIFMGGMEILVPKGNMEKSVRFVLSLVFLCLVISCVGIIPRNTKVKLPEIAPTREASQEMETASAEYVYKALLRAKGINFSKLEVCTDKTESDSIVISKVCVTTNESRQRVEEALSEVASAFELEVINE